MRLLQFARADVRSPAAAALARRTQQQVAARAAEARA